jgi:lipopolysaccharide transport system ATP-binding protein
MSDVTIRIEHLGKRYRYGGAASVGDNLRQDILDWTKGLFRRNRRHHTTLHEVREKHIAGSPDYFWAVQDINLEIKQGDVVGIIGRNGAGKSTLLKILSRITPPTTGKITYNGRIASLLEVGTGFHRELSGRENIFLNGSILGMRRAEIAKKFDEIVAFAEVEKFIDTPVKFYSSGMYVRLAFAVAAHLEPEILIVDEVLAVGDAEFQKKCLGKMDEVARHGRTVLFVSHQMAAITRLCQRAVLIEAGRIKSDGASDTVTSQYLISSGAKIGDRQWDIATAPGNEVAKLLALRVKQDGLSVDNVDIRLPVVLEMDFVNLKAQANLLCALSLFNDQGTHLFCATDFDNHKSIYELGSYTARFTIPGNLLSEGVVRICAEVSTRAPIYQIHFLEYDAAAFHVIDNGEPGSVRAGWGRPIPGVVRPKVDWAIEPLDRNRSFLSA